MPVPQKLPNKNKLFLFIITILILIATSFQNCSKVDLSDKKKQESLGCIDDNVYLIQFTGNTFNFGSLTSTGINFVNNQIAEISVNGAIQTTRNVPSPTCENPTVVSIIYLDECGVQEVMEETWSADGCVGDLLQPDGPEAANYCNQPGTLIDPVHLGYQTVEKKFYEVFAHESQQTNHSFWATVPNFGYPQPSPASDNYITSGKNIITSTKFTALPAHTMRIIWNHEGKATASGMFLTISPCKGDVRTVVEETADPHLRKGCRKFGATNGIIYTTFDSVTESTSSVCKLEAGREYYINIIMADPSYYTPGMICNVINGVEECPNGLVAGESTCNNPNTSVCGVQGYHRVLSTQ